MLYLQSNFFQTQAICGSMAGRCWKISVRNIFWTARTGPDFFGAAAVQSSGFFPEDNKLDPGMGAFDWPPMWLSQRPGTGGVPYCRKRRSRITSMISKRRRGLAGVHQQRLSALPRHLPEGR